MKRTQTYLLSLLTLVSIGGAAFGKSVTIPVRMDQVGVHTGERGAFYVVNVAVPGDIAGKRLDSVFLEFAVDATPLEEDSMTVTPIVGAYPLTSTYSGGDGQGGNSEPVFNAVVPSSRPVAEGNDRRVMMDITNIVRGWIANPASNHGLVIGSLTGPEVATVALRQSIPGEQVPIRITFFYQNRFGDRISARE
jgi:hypothetical protein